MYSGPGQRPTLLCVHELRELLSTKSLGGFVDFRESKMYPPPVLIQSRHGKTSHQSCPGQVYNIDDNIYLQTLYHQVLDKMGKTKL